MSRCLDRMNPRIFGEVIATIMLAVEQRPRCGPTTYSIDELRALNPRWRINEGVAEACLRTVDVERTSAGLETISGRTLLGVICEDGIPTGVEVD